MEKINNPKVFISYAWGTPEYQQKVINFAKLLKSNGVDVLLDKWAVVAGNDLNYYMEKCVNDESVTNVIILLDENYEKKANARKGGVGAETQIISQKVYESVTQDKFIPIVFERDANGNIHTPTFLAGKSRYDLSVEDTFTEEYMKLLKQLYGREIYIEPELGPMPDWIDKDIEIPLKKKVGFDSLKDNSPLSVKTSKFCSYLADISDRIVEYVKSYPGALEIPDKYLAAYESSIPLRTEYLVLFEFYPYIENGKEQIGSFLEETFNKLESFNNLYGTEIGFTFIHELFIYTVAGFLRKKDYLSAGYILGRTYFCYRYEPRARGFDLFYSGSRHSNLDIAIKKRDNQNYISGTANYWLSNLDPKFCSKDDFILSDLICSNYSIYSNEYVGKYPWFPITYIYDDEYNSVLLRIASTLSSREKLIKILTLFNYDSVDQFIKKFSEVDDLIKKGDFRNFGFSEAWNNVPLIGTFITRPQLGIYR